MVSPVLIAVRGLFPDLLDTTEKTIVATALAIKIRLGQEERVVRKVTRERTLVVVVSDLWVLIALDVSLFINDTKHISAAVVAAKRRKVEVSLSRSGNGVVVVVLGLSSATEFVMHVTEDEGVNFVCTSAIAGASESEDEKFTVVVLLLRNVRSEEITGPFGSSGKIRVGTVVIQIRTDEKPLGSHFVVQVSLKRSKRSQINDALLLSHDGVVSNERVLGTAISGIRGRILPAIVGRKGLVLSVLSPQNTGFLHGLNESRDVGGEAHEGLFSKSESIATDHGEVVSLRVSLNSIVVVEKKTLGGEELQIGIALSIVEVSVIENNVPDVIHKTATNSMVILGVFSLDGGGSLRVEGTSGLNGGEVTRLRECRTCKEN